MPSRFSRIADWAQFDPAGRTKADLVRGTTLFAGLNCFVTGQHERVHAHPEADKFYLVLSGKARITVGEETGVAEAGTLVWAPAGMSHGVNEALEPTVMLVVMSPPPRASAS